MPKGTVILSLFIRPHVFWWPSTLTGA